MNHVEIENAKDKAAMAVVAVLAVVLLAAILL